MENISNTEEELQIKAVEALRQMGYQQTESNQWTKPIGYWQFSIEIWPKYLRWVTVGFYKNKYSQTPSFDELNAKNMELCQAHMYEDDGQPIVEWIKDCEQYWFSDFDENIDIQTGMALQKTTKYEFK